MNLNGKKVLVTGGSRGIGRATCLYFARHGADVAIGCSASRGAAETLAEEIRALGRAAYIAQGDLGSAETTRQLVQDAAQALGGLNALVCSAATLSKSPFTEVTQEHFLREISVNLGGAFFAAQAAVPIMRAQGGGSIVLLSSQAAFNGSIGSTVYSSTKGALLSLTYSLARELAPDNIRVNCVAPGRIETEILTYASEARRREWLAEIPMDRLGTPEETASAIAFLCTDDASYITGAKLSVSGGQLMG